MEIISIVDVKKICKPPSDIKKFEPPHEVVFFTKGKTPHRNIFYFQKFSERELEKLKRLKEEIAKNKFNLPSHWDDSELLKYVYGSNFKTKKAFNDIKSSLGSRSEFIEPNLLSVNAKIINILVSLI